MEARSQTTWAGNSRGNGGLRKGGLLKCYTISSFQISPSVLFLSQIKKNSKDFRYQLSHSAKETER